MNRKLFFTTFLMLLCSLGFGQHWTMEDNVQYIGNMSIISVVQIDGIEQTNADIELAAFHDGVLRGVCKPDMLTADGKTRYVFQYTIHGNTDGELLNFKIYVPGNGENQGKEYTTDYTTLFSANGEIIWGDYNTYEPLAINFYDRHWPSEVLYENNMTVGCTIIIDGEIQERTDLEMAAFCGNEVRGVAKPVYWAGPNIYFTSLIISGNNNERIDFKVYDPIQGIEIPTEYYVTFENDAMIGEDAPLSIEFITTPYVAQVNGKKYQSLDKAFAAAQNGDEVKIIYAGTYALNTSGKDLTITGDVDGVVFDNIGAKNMGGANVTFNNVTFTYANNSTYQGLQHSGNLVYNNCTFNGQVFLYGQSETFNGCTFKQTTDNYNVWTYGAKEVAFNECTFNSAGKSVLIYAESASIFNNVTVTECTFNATAAVDGKAAIEMDSSLTAGIKLTISNTTATGFGNGNVSRNSLWNNKKGNDTDVNNDITVVVDDVTVLAPIYEAQIGEVKYRKLGTAFTAAQAGDVVKVFAGTYTMPSMKAGITVEGAVNADGTPAVLFEGTLSNTLENLTMKNIHIKGGNAQRWAYAKGNLVFENVTFEATSVYALHFDGITAGTNLTYKNCTIIGWAALGGGTPASCIFEGCTIKGNGSYGVIRTYFDATIQNCTFDVANVNTTDVYQDGIHAVGENTTVTVTNSTNSHGEMIDLVNVSGYSVVDLDGTKIMNVAKIAETEKHYWTVTEAINAAQDGQTVQLLARTINEVIAPWAGDSQHTSEKSITIVGAKDADGNLLTTLKGGLFLGYNDGTVRDNAITVKDINFVGKGVTVANQKNVVIEGNKFNNITNYVAEIHKNSNCAILVIGTENNKSICATVNKNVIYNVENNAGIYMSQVANVTVEGNTVTNTKHNAITISAATDATTTINVKDNTLAQWGLGREGRAIRISGGKTVNVNGNVMTMASAPEEFVKIIGATTIDASANYWNGNTPLAEKMFLTDLTIDPVSILKSYYTDSAKQNLVTLSASVAKIGDKYYQKLQDALDAVGDGQTITLIENVTGDEKSTKIEFTKDIKFTITGKAPAYALPVVTFQNAEVTIKDAEILIPELDARQNAVINIVNSTVHDAGGNSIAKSYYNGTINIDKTSTVYMMQITTMGYINVAGTVNATWQTNVYGNGLITLNDGAKFNTAALQLTGQDYNGRDNTDDGRVGKPAEIIVNGGAKFVVGSVKSSSGADYSYNSSKGINIGTVAGKSAVLTLNGGDVDIYMAAGQNVNIGTLGTVEVGASTMKTICRSENGTVGINNKGTINFISDNAILETTTKGLTIGYNLNQDKKVVYKDGKYQVVDKIYVAQISEDKKFETLAEAANAANGSEITIIRNFEEVYTVADGANVKINFGDYTMTGSILAPNAVLTITNGTIVNNNGRVSAIEINDGVLTLDGVKVSSARHAVRIDGDVTATINGGEYTLITSAGVTQHALNVSGTANVIINDGKFVGPKGTDSNSGRAINVQTGAKVTIYGGLYSGGKNETLKSVGELEVYGGKYDQDVKEYCAPARICKANDDIVYKYIVVPGLDGSGTETDPFLITNLTELEYFKASVNAGETTYNYPGRWVALGADIDMAGTTWREGIGDGHEWSFDGNFNGNNYTIKNLTVNPYADANKYLCGGFFGYIYGGVTIKNLVIENATINCETTEGHNVGVLVGFANNNGGKANISNVTIKGNIKVDAPNVYGVGAIVGYSYREMGTITNCTVNANDDSYINGHSFVGGITGYSYNNAIISKCSVKNINVTATSYSAGGIVGIVLAGNKVSECTVENVTVSGQANIANVVGAIAANGIVVEYCTAAEPLVGGNYSDNKPVEARIVNKYYATLEYALAAEGDNVTLLVPYTVEADETVVLDLNGKTVTGTPTEAKAYAVITNKGNLTIKNGSIVCNHTLAGSTAYAVNTITNCGTLTIDGATIENKSTATATATNQIGYAIDNNSTSTDAVLVVKSGAVKASGSNYYDGIRQFCNSEVRENSVTINGGEVSSLWMQNPSDGNTKNVKGSFSITDGKVDNVYTEPSTEFTASITGGTFVKVAYNQEDGVRDLKNYITGGAFVNNPSDYCAENYGAVYNGEYFIVKLISGTQTREFASAGWYWFSTYIDLEGTDGLEALQYTLGENAKQIKGQEGFTQYYKAYQAWSPGGLTAISTAKMYMINTTAPVTVELTGNFVDYEERDITLNTGWNWIGYPVRDTVDVKDALANLTPSNGDVIKSKDVTYTYYWGKWQGNGTLKMTPGMGYMYKSNANNVKTFRYSTTVTNNSRSENTVEEYYWIADASKYPSNMTVIAMLNIDGEAATDNYEIAAFANGECRGSARPFYVEEMDSHVLIMTIQGEEVEELTFKCYDVNYDTEYELSNRFNYSSDAILGSFEEPYMFNMNFLNIEESTLDMINIYPNPTTTDRAINLQATCDNVEVFNALGVKVAEYQNVDTIDALETAGVYVIRVTINGETRNCRLVVK